MIQNQFEDVDLILNKWLPKFGLKVRKEYKDDSVRLIEIIDDGGITYSIWIEGSGLKERYTVKAYWTLRKKVNRQHVAESWEETSSTEHLPEVLDRAYTQVCVWVASNGNTRKWDS